MNRLVGFLSISFAATLWGLDGVVLTPNLYNLPVHLVVFLLHLIPFLLMNTIFYGEYKNLLTISRKDLLNLTLVSLLGGALGTIFIVKSLFYVNFNHLSVVVLLQKLQPVFAISLSAILLKERLSKPFYLLAATAVVSGYFLTFGTSLPSFEGDDNLTIGALYALGAAFAFGSSTVFGKTLMDNNSFKFVSFFRFGFTSIIMAFITLLFYEMPDLSIITPTNWQYIICIVFTTGTTALLFYYYGLKRVKASVASIAELCFPLSAVIFDYFINGKTLTLTKILSMIIMIFSISMIGRIRMKKGD